MADITYPNLGTHMADFETTTSDLLSEDEAIALLNFAALFHEVVFIPDTALGDHRLLIDSYSQTRHSGLYSHVRKLIEARVVKALVRQKVVIRDEVIVERDPMISDLYDAWKLRDLREHKGEPGFTTLTPTEQSRKAYNTAMDRLLLKQEAVVRYDPDDAKTAFRERIRRMIDSPISTLARVMTQVESTLRKDYQRALLNPYFTNADLWRVLKRDPDNLEAIVLHGQVNQQCFADLARSGQCGRDHQLVGVPAASFNLEIRGQDTTADLAVAVDPPKNLEDLLRRAKVVLDSVSVEMIGSLSAETVLDLRENARPLFKLAKARPKPHEVEALREKYLKAVAAYWKGVMVRLQELHPDKMTKKRRLAIFVENEAPPLAWLHRNFWRAGTPILLRLWLEPLAAGLVTGGLRLADKLGVVLFQERSEAAQRLASAMPPPGWFQRGLYGLDPYR